MQDTKNENSTALIFVDAMTEGQRTKVVKEMMSGAIGMSTASFILNPLDVLKVRIQQSSLSSRGLMSCASHSVKDAGGIFRGLVVPGLTATIVRDMLNGAFRVGLYKEIERTLFSRESTCPIVIQKLVAGTVVGAMGAGLWSHTDLVKTRMQLQSPATPTYASTWDCYKQIWRLEGLKGLYRGVSPNMLRASIITTTHVGTYDASKKLLVGVLGETGATWTLCGFVSALATTTAAAPVDLVRTRVMASNLSAFQVVVSVFKSEGVQGFMRGWLASFSRFGPHFTISWPLIEISRKRIFNLDSFYYICISIFVFLYLLV